MLLCFISDRLHPHLCRILRPGPNNENDKVAIVFFLGPGFQNQNFRIHHVSGIIETQSKDMAS